MAVDHIDDVCPTCFGYRVIKIIGYGVQSEFSLLTVWAMAVHTVRTKERLKARCKLALCWSLSCDVSLRRYADQQRNRSGHAEADRKSYSSRCSASQSDLPAIAACAAAYTCFTGVPCSFAAIFTSSYSGEQVVSKPSQLPILTLISP